MITATLSIGHSRVDAVIVPVPGAGVSLSYLKLSLANFPRGAAPVRAQVQHRIDLERISKTVALSLRDRKAEQQVTFCEQFGNRLAERDGYVDRLRRS